MHPIAYDDFGQVGQFVAGTDLQPQRPVLDTREVRVEPAAPYEQLAPDRKLP